MFSDKVFQITFLVSLIAHGVLLIRILGVNIPSRVNQNKKIEVSYIAKTEFNQPLPKRTVVKPDLVHNAHSPIRENGKFFQIPEKSLRPELSVTKPALAKPDIIAIKKKITVPAINIDKINNPLYSSYDQVVREKIKRTAYKNYSSSETGEVYLSFIISADGSLKEINVIEAKSSSSLYLKGVALRSIKESAPFPAFSKELNYPQLSFTVTISFEIE